MPVAQPLTDQATCKESGEGASSVQESQFYVLFQGHITMDSVQRDYVMVLLGSEGTADGPSQPTANGSSGSGSQQYVALEEQIRQIQELLPEYGAGFLAACLAACGHNAERVTNQLLEGALPPELSKLDRSMPLRPLASRDKGKARMTDAGDVCRPTRNILQRWPTPCASLREVVQYLNLEKKQNRSPNSQRENRHLYYSGRSSYAQAVFESDLWSYCICADYDAAPSMPELLWSSLSLADANGAAAPYAGLPSPPRPLCAAGTSKPVHKASAWGYCLPAVYWLEILHGIKMIHRVYIVPMVRHTCI